MIMASAHRHPDKARELCITAQEKGFGLVIAAQGMAAALPGVVSAYTSLPVLWVSLDGDLTGDADKDIAAKVEVFNRTGTELVIA